MEFTGFGIQKQDANVTAKRNVYVGGSDVPTILGINKYKTQFELAKEKVGIEERPFVSNPYTKFGDQLEPHIREHINAVNDTSFVVDTYVNEEQRIRSNVDGIDKEQNVLLEIKTHGSNPTLKVYEAQMQLYMSQIGCNTGWLALYKRPKDFDIEFDSDNLEIREVERDDEQIKEILSAIELFWTRCEFLRNNPEMDEIEYMSIGTDVDQTLVKLNQVAPRIIEMKAALKAYEAEEKKLKEELYERMTEGDIKQIDTPFLKVTRVLPSKSKRFDSKSFKEEHPDLHKQYQVESNRKGYVKLTEKEQTHES